MSAGRWTRPDLMPGLAFLSSRLTRNAEGTNLVTSAERFLICGFALIVAPEINVGIIKNKVRE